MTYQVEMMALHIRACESTALVEAGVNVLLLTLELTAEQVVTLHRELARMRREMGAPQGHALRQIQRG